MSDAETRIPALILDLHESVVRGSVPISDTDVSFRRSWVETFANLTFHSTTEDPDSSYVSQDEFDRDMFDAVQARPELDIGALLRWLNDWREALPVERPYPANRAPPSLQVPADCLWSLAVSVMRSHSDRMTEAIIAFVRVTNSGVWPFALLGLSTTQAAATRALEGIDCSRLDEPHWVALIASMNSLAKRGDSGARTFIGSLNEESLPRKAKGELRAARFAAK